MKRAIIYIVLFPILQLQAQIDMKNDTIFIKAVEIKGKQQWQEFNGYKSYHIDSALISSFSQGSLADLISGNSGINVKSYGSGGLSTASIRGTGSGHTQVAWNNINLNNPMLGQFDMSLIPAGFADGVNILYGPASMNVNSGALGGTIDIETRPEWATGTRVLINPASGSFGKRSGLIKINTGSNYFQSVTKSFLNISNNDFPYLNSVSGPDPVWEKRRNSEIKQQGFMQELYFKKSGSTYSARLWYQSTERNLPVPIISPDMDNPEKQRDESVRGLFTYDLATQSSDLNISAAIISDNLVYDNKTASIHSVNNSRRIILKSEIETASLRIFDLSFALSDEMSFVRTSNYSEDKFRNIASFDMKVSKNFREWISARFLVRQSIMDNKFVTPDISAATELKPFQGRKYYIKVSVSKNSRIPTLNDMYWSPGGNPYLKNESGYLAELGLEFENSLSSRCKIENVLTVFRNDIRDLIQWHPGEFSYWQADNLNSMIASGFEAGLDIKYSVNRFNLRLNAFYTYINASSDENKSDNSEGERFQSVYVPEHQITTGLRLSWKNFYSSAISNYTGKRYLDSSNSSCLPTYFVTDLDIGLIIRIRKSILESVIKIGNVFNENYQNVAYYPMPGRNYGLSVVYHFKI